MILLLRLAALLAAAIFLRALGRWLGARPPAARGLLPRDPVCGTFVDAELSMQHREGGQTLHFCSERCRDAYRAGQPLPLQPIR